MGDAKFDRQPSVSWPQYMLPTAVRRTHRTDMPSAVGCVEADVTVELTPLESDMQICVKESFISLPKPWPPGSFVNAPSASF